MKKLSLLLCLTLIGSMLIAQDKKGDNKKKKTDYMGFVVVGLNYSLITGQDADSYNGKVGVVFGGAINVVDFTNMIRLLAGLEFSMQGSKYSDDTYGDGKEPTTYLNIPIVARYHSAGGFYAELGVQPGFLLSAKDKFEGQSVDIKDYYNKFDFGIPIGVGYETQSHFGVGLRVVPGVANIAKDSDSKYHNFVASLRATYSF